MPVNQSTSWFRVDFISVAPRSEPTAPGPTDWMLNLPESHYCSITFVYETVWRLKNRARNVCMKSQNLLCCCQILVEVWQRRSHLRGPSLLPLNPGQRDEGLLFVRWSLLGSYRTCTLPDILLSGVCANVSTRNDSGIFQEAAERCDGTLQFYFEQSRKPKGLLGLRITHKGVVDLAERRRGLKRFWGWKQEGEQNTRRDVAISN